MQVIIKAGDWIVTDINAVKLGTNIHSCKQSMR